MIDSGCADSSIDFKPLRRGNALGGAAEASHHKKQRHLKDEVERLIVQAKEYEQTNMKSFEVHYTSVIKSARATTKAWLSDGTSSERASMFAAAIQNIKKNASAISSGQGKSSSRDKFCKFVEELQLLRNLSDSYIPLELLDSSHAYSVVDEIERTCTKEAIVALCTQLKEQWRLQLQKHLIVGATSWDECPIHFKPTLAQKRSAMKAFGGHGDSRHGKKGAAFGTITSGGKGGKFLGLANAPPPVKPRPRSKNGKGSTGIGKGRKICHHCNRIVGSPSRVCPYCKGDLPMKKASAAK
jgi:hypothetical protein